MAISATPYKWPPPTALSINGIPVGSVGSVSYRNAEPEPASFTSQKRQLTGTSGYVGVWHICWDEPPAPIGLNTRALRHLRRTGKRMSRRNYRQSVKSVGRAA